MTQTMIEISDAIRSMSDAQYTLFRSVHAASPAPAAFATAITPASHEPLKLTPTMTPGVKRTRPSRLRRGERALGPLRWTLIDMKGGTEKTVMISAAIGVSKANIQSTARKEDMFVQVQRVRGGDFRVTNLT
mgnify:CR=1 FL=1